MKKAVIFDLDGTLIHSLPDIAAAMNRSLSLFGLPTYPENDYKYKVGNGVLKLTERAVGQHKEFYDQVLEAYKKDYAAHNQVETRPFKGIGEMLEKLRELGLSLCVLTNKDQGDAENILGHFFPDIVFSGVLGRQEGLRLKPDPEGALRLAALCGASPEECWYVGDTATDMNCGNAAGMETVGVLWGYRPREELVSSGARHLIAEPGELIDLAMN